MTSRVSAGGSCRNRSKPRRTPRHLVRCSSSVHFLNVSITRATISRHSWASNGPLTPVPCLRRGQSHILRQGGPPREEGSSTRHIHGTQTEAAQSCGGPHGLMVHGSANTLLLLTKATFGVPRLPELICFHMIILNIGELKSYKNPSKRPRVYAL